jgi:hypothetical protein
MISQACTPLGFVTVAVTPTTAVGFTNGIVAGTTTFTIPAGANLAVLVALTGGCMWRDDGTAPTPTAGMPMLVSQPPFEYSGDLKAIQFISVSGTVAVEGAFFKVAG